MTGPVILIGATPLCHGGTLSVDLTVPIVTCWSVSCKLRIFHPFVYNSSLPYPKHIKELGVLELSPMFL